MFESLFKDGKLKKGKALHVGVISILTTALFATLYTVGSYASTKMETHGKDIATLKTEVTVLSNKTPITRKDLSDELKTFNESQSKLYSNLADQTQANTATTVRAYATSNAAMVQMLVDQQKDFTKDVERQFEKAEAQTEAITKQVEYIQNLSAKDREVLKVLQQNFNETLRENSKKQKQLEEKLNLILQTLQQGKPNG